MTEYHLQLPGNWVHAQVLENALGRAGEPHGDVYGSMRCVFPSGCKVMVDACVRLLSLVNQLAHVGRQVTLEFEEGPDGTMGYLDRIGFLEQLASTVAVVPAPPAQSAGARYRGRNPELVELRAISLGKRDRDLPQQLADAVVEACSGRTDRKPLGHATYTLFAELVDNIFEHSETQVDGYAAVQAYHGGGEVWVAVSDSGCGILETVRPSLKNGSLRRLSDPELIVHMFNEGLSRFGAQRGCGLHQCASHALKYQAHLLLRLPTSCLELVPGDGCYVPNKAYIQAGLPLLWGTHIVFQFRLDK